MNSWTSYIFLNITTTFENVFSLYMDITSILVSLVIVMWKITSKWQDLVKFLFLFQRYAIFLSFAAIFEALSRPKSSFAYCIHALAKRLAKTSTWTVWSISKLFLHPLLLCLDVFKIFNIIFTARIGRNIYSYFVIYMF